MRHLLNLKNNFLVIVFFLPCKLIFTQTYYCELDTLMNQSNLPSYYLNIYKLDNKLNPKLITNKLIMSNSNLFSFQVQDDLLWTMEAFTGTSSHDLVFILNVFEFKKNRVVLLENFQFHEKKSVKLDNLNLFVQDYNLYFKYINSSFDLILLEYPLTVKLFKDLPEISKKWIDILKY